MDYSNRILKKFQYSSDKEIEYYDSKDIAIFRPKITMNKRFLLKDSYSLVLTRSYVSRLKVDKKMYVPRENKLFIVNPGQTVEGIEAKSVEQYYAVYLRRHLLEKLSRQFLKRPILNFENKNYEIEPGIINLMNKFIYEAASMSPGYEFMLECLSSQLVVSLLRNIILKEPVPVEYKKARRKEVKRAIEYIRTYYNRDFSLDELAAAVNLSPYHFIRVFKAETEKTPFEYLLEVKIEKAKELLESNNKKITEIGLACGFSNPSHFSRVFKKNVGISPTDYRAICCN